MHSTVLLSTLTLERVHNTIDHIYKKPGLQHAAYPGMQDRVTLRSHRKQLIAQETMVSTRKITADKRPDLVFEQTLFLSPTFNRPNQHPRVHADHPDHPW